MADPLDLLRTGLARGIVQPHHLKPEVIHELERRTLQGRLDKAVEALKEITAGRFNCAPAQRFMAAQAVAERTLGELGEPLP